MLGHCAERERVPDVTGRIGGKVHIAALHPQVVLERERLGGDARDLERRRDGVPVGVVLPLPRHVGIHAGALSQLEREGVPVDVVLPLPRHAGMHGRRNGRQHFRGEHPVLSRKYRSFIVVFERGVAYHIFGYGLA